MSRKITFKVGIPQESVTVDLNEVNEDIEKWLKWWQGPGPKDICPFVSVRGRCLDICGRIFPTIENVYKTCPFKQKFNEVALKPLVQRILDEISK
jgi:hypothetical protein